MEEVKKTDVLVLLSGEMPKDSIQVAKKEKTNKGYDTTGVGYQWCVNRFNEVLGTQWGYEYKILKEEKGVYKKSGTEYYDITVEMSIWIGNEDTVRVCIGGHIAVVYADALKGAITNAFKKTAAFWGVGRQAYEGSLDDDISYPEVAEDKVSSGEIKYPNKNLPPATEKQIEYINRLFKNLRMTPEGVVSFLSEQKIESISNMNMTVAGDLIGVLLGKYKEMKASKEGENHE